MKLLYLWIAEDENQIFVNQGFNLGGRYHFEYQLNNNTIFVKNKKNYIENFYNMSINPECGIKDITAIVGANGSGKSTLINLIKEMFSGGYKLLFGKSILEDGMILVTEDYDSKLITILYGGNIRENLVIQLEDPCHYNIHYDKVSEYEDGKINILIKKYGVSEGVNGFKSSIINEVEKVKIIYFSNVVDYFFGGNASENKITKLHDISTNGLIKNDIKNINIHSRVNVAEAISKRLNISQLEVFQKYENIRMVNFITGNHEFDIPFEVPNEIELIFFDFIRYNYESNNEYQLIQKLKEKIINKINEKEYNKKSLALIGIVVFLLQEIIDVIPYIANFDDEFLMKMSLHMEYDYYGYINERNIYSEEYSIEEEIRLIQQIYNKITDEYIDKCNVKQKELVSKYKESTLKVLELYSENKGVYLHEIREISEGTKELEEYNIMNLFNGLDDQWKKTEELKNEMCLSEGIERKVVSILQNEILELLEKDNIESIKKIIEEIGKLIEDNYNSNYLRNIGTFHAIYNTKFFRTEVHALKKLVDILWGNIDKDRCKFILKLDSDKSSIKEFIGIYKGSNILYKLCDIGYGNISSGERAFLNLCSRFYSIQDDINISESTYESILVLIDEIDLYFHPQWQKELIYNLSYLLSKIYEGKKIQIILSSHSPFVLSDIQKCNIIFMDKDTSNNCIVCKGIEEEKETFAANIHTLFTDSFFVKDGLIGKLAKEKINKMIDILNSNKDFKSYEEKENAKKLIYSIGEPLIRNKLINMYKEKIDISDNDKIDSLKKDMKFLAERIRILENKENK
jgi:energy-coupling factor transporter ATP-binding protein EcfA2